MNLKICFGIFKEKIDLESGKRDTFCLCAGLMLTLQIHVNPGFLESNGRH